MPTKQTPTNEWDHATIARRNTISPAQVEDDIERLYSMMGVLALALMMRVVNPDPNDFADRLLSAGKAILSNFPEDYKTALIAAVSPKGGV